MALPLSLRTERPCFVYVIVPVEGDRPGPVKVGISASPAGRLLEIQTACPFRIEAPWTWRFPSREMARDVEGRFHAGHAKWRISGEWFHMDCVGAACDIDALAISAILDRGYSYHDLAGWGAYIGMSEEHLHDLLLGMGVRP